MDVVYSHHYAELVVVILQDVEPVLYNFEIFKVKNLLIFLPLDAKTVWIAKKSGIGSDYVLDLVESGHRLRE